MEDSRGDIGDRVSRIQSEWRRERPDVDVQPQGIIGRVHRLAAWLTDELTVIYGRYGLGEGEFDVLAALRREGPPYTLSPGRLLQVTLVTSGTMTNRIDRLEDKGLVERAPDPSDRRGVQVDLSYVGNRAMLIYDLPLNEVIFDFFDQLKSRSRGYASLDYELKGYHDSDLVKLDFLLNGEICDAFTMIVHKDKAYGRARNIAEKLKDVIPRQQFEIPIQGAIGSKIIARETVKAVRKDVLAKCYGGDITRKKKLLEKQKEGKKRMRRFGSVELPSEAFIAVLKMGDD